jgi:hypothetical protein
MIEAKRFVPARRLFAVAAVLIVAAGIAGCGDTVIDSAKTEAAVQADLEDSIRAKIRVVDCPSDQKVEAGATFTCTIDYANGEHATATLKIRNEDADVSFVGLKPTP